MNAKRRWPLLLTAIIFATACLVPFFLPSLDDLDKLGGYLAGFVGAIAFVWLIAAYYQQGSELELQRGELALQRQSLDLQREELQKMGKYAALEQVRTVLEQFDQSLKDNPKAPARSTTELLTAFTNGMEFWKVLLTEGGDPTETFNAFVKWQAIHSACDEFLARVCTAVDIYSEATNTKLLCAGGQPSMRLYGSLDVLTAIPYVRHYAGSANMLAEMMSRLEPGLNQIMLNGFEATEKLMPGVVKQSGLDEYRAKVTSWKQQLAKRSPAQST